MRLLSIAFLFFGVMIGCSSEDPFSELKQDAQQFQLERAADLKLVQEPDFIIGSYQTVNDIGSLTIDKSGRIFALNNTRKRIEVYSAEGEHLQSLGKSGSDPGEFQNPELLKTDGNYLYAFDNSLQRINVFLLDDLNSVTVVDISRDELLESDSTQQTVPFTFEVLAEGDLLVGFRVTETPDDQREVYYRMNKSQNEVEFKISKPVFMLEGKGLYVDDTRTTTVIMELPYLEETLVLAGQDSVLYRMNTAEFLIQKYDWNGNYLGAFYYPMKRQPLKKDDILDLYTNVHYRRAIRGADLPNTWPAVDHMLVDDEGRIWIATITDNLENYRWFVTDEAGNLVGTFDLPRKQTIEAVRNNFMYIKRYNPSSYSHEIRRYSFTQE